MQAVPSDLVVRGSDRYQCALVGSLQVAKVHARQVKPDTSAPGAGGPVDVKIVDLSSGGVGIRSSLFFPQGCRLTLRLTTTHNSEPLIVEVRVQRAMMLDRAPTYYLGTAFENLTPKDVELVTQMLVTLKVSGAAVVSEKPRA